MCVNQIYAKSNHYVILFNSEPLIRTEEPIPSCSGVNINEKDDQTNTKNGLNGTTKPILGSPVTNINLPATQCNGFTGSKEERNGCIRRNADTTVIIVLRQVNY